MALTAISPLDGRYAMQAQAFFFLYSDLDHAFDIRHHTRFSGAIIDRALRDQNY
jgi:hypothetical protein